MKLEKRTKIKLDRIDSKGLRRKLSSPKGIDLSSNDYLDLANDQRISAAMSKGIELEGVGSTGSRLLRGERICFEEVERQFANWKGTERSLYFATGYQANVGLLQTFLEQDDVVFSDELNHASLIDGIRLSRADKVIFKHLNTQELERNLHDAKCNGQKFLVTESLFSMDGDIAPLKEYARICRETDTNLIVDEAHAVGVYGANGSGLIEELGIENDVFISINTVGKALGVSGAFLAGKDWVIEYLIQRARSFIFSTAPTPSISYALKAAIDIASDEAERRKRLLSLSGFFRKLLRENGVDVPLDNSQIVPILIGDNEKAVRMAEEMQNMGFDVRAIRPPTVAEGTARLRVSLNSSLSEKVLTRFVENLLSVFESLKRGS